MNVTALAPLAALICAIFGVTDPGLQADIKSVLAGAAAVVIAVWTWETHKTSRNTTNAAATVQVAKAAASTPLALQEAKQGVMVAGVQPGAKQVLPLGMPSGSVADDIASGLLPASYAPNIAPMIDSPVPTGPALVEGVPQDLTPPEDGRVLDAETTPPAVSL